MGNAPRISRLNDDPPFSLSLDEEELLQSNVSTSPEEEEEVVSDVVAGVLDGGHRGGN